MPGKPALAVLLVDDLAALKRMTLAALADRLSPGVIDATEAGPIVRLIARCHHGGRVVNLAQMEGLTWTRYRQAARDHATEAADIDLPPAA